MILKNEIIQKSTEWQVPPDTVDKDYVLGHFLSVFIDLPEHKNKLVFKGGTALRKCYFSDYRFSEDLDFTSIDPNYKLTRSILNQIKERIEQETGILLHIQKIIPLKHKNKLTGYQAKIKYWGANHSKNQEPPPHARWTSAIKVEITLFETLVFEPVVSKINHPYSDDLIGLKEISCYILKEVVSEKLRALIQRSYTAPRDLYDIYMLLPEFNDADWSEIKTAFLKKMQFKNKDYEGINQLINEDNIIHVKKAWERSLTHQIPKEQLPDFEALIKKITQVLNKYL